ncbi:pitrilysin family protein, partial [Balneolaceae bacterium ANBcel3]|nr:pitrilysin family protein [Balneolaceae bacterium ANBcel3]
EAATIQDALDFYETHYVPSNMTIAVSGDVDPEEIKAFAEKYFSPMPAGGQPPKLLTREPPQRGERRLVIKDDAQPILMIAYKGLDANHPDAIAVRMIYDLLLIGRTSRLYRRLITEEEAALHLFGNSTYPGNRFPGLFILAAFPNQGVDVADLEKMVYEEIERIKQGDISPEELERIRINRRANTLRGLSDNIGIAYQFASSHRLRGTWKAVFEDLDRLDDISVDDLQQAAMRLFREESRTVGYTINEDDETTSSNDL